MTVSPALPRSPQAPLSEKPVASESGSPGTGLTLADVMSRLEAKPDLEPHQRRDLLSALHTLCRLLNAQPDAVPAQPGILRKRLATVVPAAESIKRRRFANVRSLTLTALKIAGVPAMRGRTTETLTADWETLRARLPNAHARHGLSRFMSRCSEQHLAPGAVDIATFESFGLALKNDSLTKAPHTIHRTTCLLWNAAADTIDGWPQLTVPVPSASRRYALAGSDFPVSFQDDGSVLAKLRAISEFGVFPNASSTTLVSQ